MTNARPFGLAFLVRSPDRIRTGVTALRGRRPRPLDDGAVLVLTCCAGVASAVQTTVSPPVRPTGGSGGNPPGMNERGRTSRPRCHTELLGYQDSNLD